MVCSLLLKYTMIYEYSKRKRDFSGRHYFPFSLVFSILGAFPVKQFSIPLTPVGYAIGYSQLGATGLVGYLPSQNQRAVVE